MAEKRWRTDPKTGARIPITPGGKPLPSGEDVKREKWKQRFLEEKGWAGIGGAARRPEDWEKQFNEWLKKKREAAAKNKAQKEAVKETE